MKTLVTALAVLAFFVSCEKDVNPIITDPIQQGLKSKTIDWIFISDSAFEDTGYSSIQPANYPSVWSFTRTTKMNLTAVVDLDNEPVHMSGSFILKQIDGGRGGAVSEGHVHICETRDGPTDHCLDFVYQTNIYEYSLPRPDLSDLKSTQSFEGSLYLEHQSGRFHLPENDGLFMYTILTLDPVQSSGRLNVKGTLYY